MRAIVIALCGSLALACGHPTPPQTPNNSVRSEVAQAETAERARQHGLAREHYERAIATAHDPASLVYARGEFAETLISWGEYRQAIQQLEAVVAANPHHAPAWHDLGLLYHHEGDDDRAISALERSRTAAPRDPRPRISLALLRWKRGDLEGASQEYRALLALDLPDAVRGKVQWALDELARRRSAAP